MRVIQNRDAHTALLCRAAKRGATVGPGMATDLQKPSELKWFIWYIHIYPHWWDITGEKTLDTSNPGVFFANEAPTIIVNSLCTWCVWVDSWWTPTAVFLLRIPEVSIESLDGSSSSKWSLGVFSTMLFLCSKSRLWNRKYKNGRDQPLCRPRRGYARFSKVHVWFVLQTLGLWILACIYFLMKIIMV